MNEIISVPKGAHLPLDTPDTVEIPFRVLRIENIPFLAISAMASRIAIDRAAIEAEGFVLAWERPL